MIEVWNSSGRKRVNNTYLTHALHYLYDDYTATSSGATLPFNMWHQPWTTEDRSDNSPRQGNSYDCGIFTLVSIALLAQGVRLNKQTYSQSIIYGLATRRRIAYIIWSSGRNDSGTHSRGIIGFLRTPDAPPDPVQLTPTTLSPKTGKRGYIKKRQRVAKGSSTTAKHSFRYSHIVSPYNKLLNPKRSAKSLSTAGVKKLMPSERKIPRKRRKRQMTIGETMKRRQKGD